jgi:hypothetical protein
MQTTAKLIFSGLTLSAIFTTAIVACDTNYDKSLQQGRAIALARAECPDGMKDEQRLHIVLNAAYHSSDLKPLNDAKVAICVNPALAAAKTPEPYHRPVAAVFLPSNEKHSSMVQLWDDGNSPIKIRPILNRLSVISHPPQVYRGVDKILKNEKRGLKPDQPAIAIMDGQCGYNCTNINWYAPEQQADLLKLNPTLLSRPR